MARKQSGGFNKLLNFIGLVDDDPRDTYGEEYQSDNYGRQAAYTPVRSSRNGRAAAGRNAQPARRSLPAPSRTNRYDDRYERSDRASGGYDDYRASSRRPASRFEDDGYDYMPRTERAASRFAAEPSPRYEEPVQREAPVRAMRVSQRSRTDVYKRQNLSCLSRTLWDRQVYFLQRIYIKQHAAGASQNGIGGFLLKKGVHF